MYDNGSGSLKVSIQGLSELERRADEITSLARRALEPNAFYEPWMLLPALRYLGNKHVRIVSVQQGLNLVGLFPIERRFGYRGLPFSYLRLWKHRECFLCTPLIDASCASECLQAFLSWLKNTHHREILFEFGCIAGDGHFFTTLQQVLTCRNQSYSLGGMHLRAMLHTNKSHEQYFRDDLSRAVRKELRRKTKKLSALGEICIITQDDQPNEEFWAHEFLELEKSGWKGEQGTALACLEDGDVFLKEVLSMAAASRSLSALALLLNGRPIAILLNFLSGEGAFAYKIAYDQRFKDSSPGLLLEHENLSHMLDKCGTAWMDSCADPNTQLLNKLYKDRREIRCINVALSRTAGKFIVSAMPLAMRAKQQLGRLFRSFPSVEVKYSPKTSTE